MKLRVFLHVFTVYKCAQHVSQFNFYLGLNILILRLHRNSIFAVVVIDFDVHVQALCLGGKE